MVRVTVEDNKVKLYTADNVIKVVNFTNKLSAMDVAAMFCVENIYNMHHKQEIIDAYKRAADVLGCSCHQFAKIINAAMIAAYVTPNKDLINRFATTITFNRRGRMLIRDTMLVNTVNANAANARQYFADGMSNLAAFGAVLGMSARTAKRHVGKGMWKRLCKNSCSRNDAIVAAIKGDLFLIPQLIDVPSTILTRSGKDILHTVASFGDRCNIPALLNRIITHIGGYLNKIDGNKVIAIRYLVEDTINMCNDAGVTFNPKWSLNRIKEVHDKLSREIALKGLSTDTFAIADFLPHSYGRMDLLLHSVLVNLRLVYLA